MWEEKLVGYRNDSKCVRIYNPNTNRVVESTNVTIIETTRYNIRPADEEGKHFWGDVISHALMLKPPRSLRVCPTGLIDHLRSEVAGRTEHGLDSEGKGGGKYMEPESNQGGDFKEEETDSTLNLDSR